MEAIALIESLAAPVVGSRCSSGGGKKELSPAPSTLEKPPLPVDVCRASASPRCHLGFREGRGRWEIPAEDAGRAARGSGLEEPRDAAASRALARAAPTTPPPPPCPEPPAERIPPPATLYRNLRGWATPAQTFFWNFQ
uniref:Uncharacterized protein n=1 Tax=Otus sunia TaxID=257818 RepID=A0A8C8AZA7_9STRI